MSREKTIAVVVSCNRLKMLSECIEALKAQSHKPDAILVINNGSTDDTEPWLEKQEGIFFISQENCGSGGGFNRGISWAYQKGYSWIWCMDDDGYPHPDALHHLLKNEGNERALLNCAVINKEDKKTFVWKMKDYQTIDDVKEEKIEGICHPFNGTLIHRSIVERVGLPKKSLFVWGDETEYLFRITKVNKFPTYTITSALHYHPSCTFSYKSDWEYRATWKMYYYIRNRLFIHKSKWNNTVLAFLNYVGFLFAFAAAILIFQRTDRVKKLSFMVWPAVDAIRNNFTAFPDDIVQKLGRKHNLISESVLFYMKDLWLSMFPESDLVRHADPVKG